MSIINRGLGFTRSLILRGLGGESTFDDTNNSVRELSISIESNIKPQRLFYPLTGIYSENENVEGWNYSRSFPQDLNNIYQRIENSIGGYEYNLEEGSLRSDWEGATLEGIRLEEIIKVYKRNYSSQWLPKVSGGTYSIYWLEKTLYADESSAKLLKKKIRDPVEVEGEGDEEIIQEVYPFVDLPYGSSNIAVTVFKRDNYFVNLPWLKYNFKNNNETIDTDYSFEVEEIIEDQEANIEAKTLIKINSFFEKQVGLVGDFDYENNNSLIENFEFAGLGSPYRSIIYSEYFPITEVRLIEEIQDVNGNTSIVEWKRVETFSHSNEKEFVTDNLNGKIVINKSEEKTFFSKSYSEESQELFFYNSLTDWPLSRGVIEIEGSRYNYYDKSFDSISLSEPLNAQLDYDGAKIKFLKEGQNFETLSNLWIGYKCIPRLDYELYPNLRSSKADLKPYRKIDSNGILEINPYETHVSRLEVKSDLPFNSGIYGPLTMGGEATKITATAYNSHGTPVKELPVTFYSDLGKFNSGKNSAKSITNEIGEAYSYYNWPYSQDSDHILIERINHVDGNTEIEFSGHSVGYNGVEANIFQVAKDDPFYGSLGWEAKIVRLDEYLDGPDDEYIVLTLDKDLPNLEEYFTNQMLYLEYQSLSTSEDFNEFVADHNCQDLLINYCLGFIKIQASGKIFKIIVDKIIDKNKIAVKNNYMSNGNFQFSTGEGVVNSIVLYKRNEMVFDPELVKNGYSYDRVMYYDDGNGNELMPIKPSEVKRLESGNVKVTYNNILLPLCNMESDSNLIAAYKIFIDRVARVWAETIDPATGRVVKSNVIKILISLPQYLKGDHGFKIYENNTSYESSGLGGANFLTLSETEASNGYQPDLITLNPFHKNIINFFIQNDEV